MDLARRRARELCRRAKSEPRRHLVACQPLPAEGDDRRGIGRRKGRQSDRRPLAGIGPLAFEGGHPCSRGHPMTTRGRAAQTGADRVPECRLDSPLEGDGFELPVPREMTTIFEPSCFWLAFKIVRVPLEETDGRELRRPLSLPAAVCRAVSGQRQHAVEFGQGEHGFGGHRVGRPGCGWRRARGIRTACLPVSSGSTGNTSWIAGTGITRARILPMTTRALPRTIRGTLRRRPGAPRVDPGHRSLAWRAGTVADIGQEDGRRCRVPRLQSPILNVTSPLRT
jgi:hypothetical protein